ncbi:glycosyltransferase family 2 protein [Paenibacillus xerothermodurans]|uniref:Glycosyltransferase family 2 protein n=1 Tax=Paenibacillus xerothermodurans TaxID=1977292 RepID=A0A2W1P0L0_PAEXE|nr:glycosyltransferase family 2 protein [Paenibacillus xerothermodurans]PZE20618.1 glycosyltransferase family 2 protein [Paenibacillus xerothermodurans]
MLKVSCILTSYNRRVLIRDAITSVINQTYPNWELFIVDDNSNEETQEIIAAFASADPRIQVLQTWVKAEDRKKTTRYATCINLAIPRISGDLVTYLTDDDIYFPRRFEKMVEVFETYPHVYVLYGQQRLAAMIDGVVHSRGIRPLAGITREPATKLDHNSVMHRAACFKLVPRWNDDRAIVPWADAVFFEDLARYWDFYPLDFITDEHRYHEHSIQAKYNRQEEVYTDKTE